nr:unnamed protein product [Digitaria exilis]
MKRRASHRIGFFRGELDRIRFRCLPHLLPEASSQQTAETRNQERSEHESLGSAPSLGLDQSSAYHTSPTKPSLAQTTITGPQKF